MRRLRPGAGRAGRPDDAGTVALLVAVLLGGGVLLGTAAVTVDVGQIYAERRQVQNGADAAALAVAGVCALSASCDAGTGGLARSMADGNANDAATAVRVVCGAGRSVLPGCSAQTGPVLAECPSPPVGVQGWVRVGTGTSAPDGSTLLPSLFARALIGNRGYAGTAVQACAQAAWGPPSALDDALPVTLSECEWNAASHNGTAFAAPSPYPPYPQGEVALALHSTSERGGCPASGGAYADLPGGFGWLDGGSACRVAVAADGTVPADPGVSASTCAGLLAARVGSVLYLPVFDEAWGSGSGGSYRISGFAAFYLSGYSLPGAHPSRVASPVGGHLCQGSDKCIYGWFTQGLVPGAPGVGGRAMGALAVALTG